MNPNETPAPAIPHPAQGLPPLRISRTRRATFFTLVGLGTVVGTWLMVVYLGEGGLGPTSLLDVPSHFAQKKSSLAMRFVFVAHLLVSKGLAAWSD